MRPISGQNGRLGRELYNAQSVVGGGDQCSDNHETCEIAVREDLGGPGGGTLTRIALGGVAHRPWRARKPEAALRGAPATEETFRRVAEAELADAQPLPGNVFKVSLACNVLVRTLLDLLGEDKR